MSERSDHDSVRSEDIEDFLNESFMIVDELEDNHNSKTEKDTEEEKNAKYSPSRATESPDVVENTEKDSVVVIEDEDPNEEIGHGEERKTEDKIDGETKHKEEGENVNKDREIEREVEEDDTEIEEIASGETCNLDSSGVSKPDEVKVKVEKITTEETNGQEVEEEEEEEDTIDSHPYLYLIESFELTKEQKTVTNIGSPQSIEETPFQLVYTRKQLLQLLQTLRSAKEIAVNLHMDTKVFNSTLCLMEISTRDSDYIIDGLKLKNDLLLLTEIFINPKIVKIFYKADQILNHLQQRLHLFVVNVFDIPTAGMALKGETFFSLFTMLKKEYSYDTNQQFHNADFRARPISQDIIKYCRSIPHYLIHIYHTFKNKLLKKEKLYKKVMDECRNMCKVLYPDYHVVQLAVLEEEMRKRHGCQLEILKNVYSWRESLARSHNKNPELIINKQELLHLASSMPIDEQGVLAACKSHYIKSDMEKIIAMVVRAKEKHDVYTKKLKMRNRIAPSLNSIKESTVPQGVKRGLDDKKSESQPTKQKRTEVTVNKTKNEPSHVTNKVHEKPSHNQNKHKPNNKVSKRVEVVQKPSKPSSSRRMPKPSTFVSPNLNKSAPPGSKTNTSFRSGSSFLNQSAPKPSLNLSFNSSTSAINSSTPRKGKRARKSRFEPVVQSLTLNPMVLKPTNVPSNTHFQTTPTFSQASFQASVMNKFQDYCSPLSNFSVNRDDGINRFTQMANIAQGGRINTFNQVFDVIDQKINTLERKVSKFQVTSDPNDMESNMYRRRYN